MIKTFDGMIDGKHVEKWEPTEEEKAAIQAKIEELKNRHDNERLHSTTT